MGMAKLDYVVVSDMHFGMADSEVNDRGLLRQLGRFLAFQAPLTAVILAGDVLDLNLSTFGWSIEGNRSRGIVGFREFLTIVGAGTLAVGRWIYIPGNHDYRIWDLLSTRAACTDVLARGDRLRPAKMPLRHGRWQGADAFVSGIFPEPCRDRVEVVYPEQVIPTPRGDIVVTHGHYFDPKQSLGRQLAKLVRELGDRDAAVRRLFIDTAAYQTLASCVSFSGWSRKWINLLVGEHNLGSQVGSTVRGLIGADRDDLLVSPLRGKGIDAGQLAAMEIYLQCFRPKARLPRYLVYGHTHVQDRSSLDALPARRRVFPGVPIDVHNTGAFYRRGAARATFLGIRVRPRRDPEFVPLYMDERGVVAERR